MAKMRLELEIDHDDEVSKESVVLEIMKMIRKELRSINVSNVVIV